jgi:hypothetical protein
MLRTLASSVEIAVCRTDSRHPAFHGCLDWHSAVHGTYALLTASRLTGDSRYRDTALTAIGGAAAVAAETDAVLRGALRHEVPYGMAWALHLDLEAAQADIDWFRNLAYAARDRLIAHLRRRPETRRDELAERAFRSTAWAASALLAWGDSRGDGEAQHTARELADHLRTAGGGSRRIPKLASNDEFFSAPHMAAMLAMRAGLAASDVRPILACVDRTVPLTPSRMSTPHSAGLNFSRAWGSFGAWVLTGRQGYRDDFARLVMTHVNLPQYWRENYLDHAHWVPQFGVFAIALTDGRAPMEGDQTSDRPG